MPCSSNCLQESGFNSSITGEASVSLSQNYIKRPTAPVSPAVFLCLPVMARRGVPVMAPMVSLCAMRAPGLLISLTNIKETAMSNLPVFQFDNVPVHALIDDEGSPWFIASEICKALGYQNTSLTIQKHCREGGVSKRYTPINGIKQTVTVINEGNVYRLAIKSRKKESERFEAWVCDEVLPAIRKTGSYNQGQLALDTIKQSLTPKTERVLTTITDDKVESRKLKDNEVVIDKFDMTMHLKYLMHLTGERV